MHWIYIKCRFRTTVGYGDVIKLKGLTLDSQQSIDPELMVSGSSAHYQYIGC